MAKPFDPRVARAARAYTQLSHIALGRAAGVASRTIYKLERDGSVTTESLDKILRAFSDLGVVAVKDDDGVIVGLSFLSNSTVIDDRRISDKNL